MLITFPSSVVAATATQISYLPRAFTPNFTLTKFPYIICTETVQALSLVTTCTLYMQPLFESLESGLRWKDNIQRLGGPGDEPGSVTQSQSMLRNIDRYTEI